jgi:tripeptide aminopeptidase
MKKSPKMKNASSGPATRDIDVRRSERLVMQLMAIRGPSCEEGPVAEYVVQKLQHFGVDSGWIQFDRAHHRTPALGEVGNLIVKLPGTSRQPRRMLSAHLDTVPICVGSKPTRKGNLVRSAAPGTGLGADNRAGCAVLLNSVAEVLQRQLLHPPLTFCWFVQEEIGLQGSRTATRTLWGNPKLAFNWDGGSPSKLTVGATGGYRTKIDIEGIASHAGGAPEEGVSAIAIAAVAIANLQRDGWHGDIRQEGRHGTSNVGFIHGGAHTNVVTDRVTVRAEARSHDPQFRKKILQRIEQAFRDAVGEVRNVNGKKGKVRIASQLDYESFLLSPDAECITVAEEAVQSVGRQPLRAVANGGVDANWITAHGIPTVSLGCGQRNQHMVTENLNLAEFHDACRIAVRIAAGRGAGEI